MRRAITVVFGLSIAFLGLMFTAYAGDVLRMKVNVEFPFQVYDDKLPAGEYYVELRSIGGASASGSLIAFVWKDGSRFIFPSAYTAGYRSSNSEAYLLFKRVGTSYFLSKVHQNNIEASIGKSKTQKEMELAYAREIQTAATKNVKVSATKE
jgi:hypothetical protein